MNQIIECVPNISEGRDKEKINLIVAEIEKVKDVKVLNVDPGYATNRTVITFVDGSKELHSEGIVEGVITTDPRGNDGFGYDPIFLPRDSQFTFSEMTQVEKNKISHRGRALIKMKKLLEPYYKREKL